MPELDDTALERRLRGVLQEHLGALPLNLTVDALDRRRDAKGVARRSARSRGITLLAAAALFIVGGALAAGSGLLRLPTVVPPIPEPSVMAVATASPDEASPRPSGSAAPSASPIPVAGPGGAWIQTGSMVTPRYEHAAVQLLDGRVLVVGGTQDSNGPELTSAELYDPVSGTWSATGSMLKPRYGLPPTLLLDGRVLVGDRDDAAADVVTFGSEVYDPESGTWSSSGTMTQDFVADGSTATLLRDGKVLVSGLSGAQLYDPDSGTWSATGTMITPRHNHTATLLRDGDVLVAGGYQIGRSCGLMECHPPPDEAELYDPDTGSWTAIPNSTAEKSSPRFGGQWASLLQDGTVLLMFDSTKLYDPTSGTWSALGAPPPGGPVALLPDDTVLLAVEGSPCTAAALYDPHSGSWTSAPSKLRCESATGQPGSSTLLRDGTVLAAGGSQCNGDNVCVSFGSAELYVPAGVSLPPFSFPSPPPVVIPDPTPTPTPAPLLPPAVGPTPPNALSWKVTVDNRSSEPATLFVATDDGTLRLVGSATPNVVPAGTTMKVTFRFPDHGGWIFVNPRPGGGAGGGLVNEDQIGIPGKILIREDGEVGWLSSPEVPE
jgi:hypothetical protein